MAVGKFIPWLVVLFDTGKNGRPKEWWEDFPEMAYIVIDEFQFLLSNSSRYKKGGVNYTEKFMQYISMHRHKGHDLLLLSQSVKNITNEARRQFEVLFTVMNVKNMTFGIFPFTIPMSDIETVREAWGMQAQLARIQRHIVEGEKFVPQKGVEMFLLRPSIFRLYKSETLLSEGQDRPKLDLSRRESVVWLLRRHAFR